MVMELARTRMTMDRLNRNRRGEIWPPEGDGGDSGAGAGYGYCEGAEGIVSGKAETRRGRSDRRSFWGLVLLNHSGAGRKVDGGSMSRTLEVGFLAHDGAHAAVSELPHVLELFKTIATKRRDRHRVSLGTCSRAGGDNTKGRGDAFG